MVARKTDAVKEAVAMVVAGKVPTAYAAAKQAGVSASSIHRDPNYKAWKARKEQGKQ
jgi:hypothetical protein